MRFFVAIVVGLAYTKWYLLEYFMPIFTLFGLTFHWRDDKWQATYDKRKIDIDEAVSVFNDPNQFTVIDDRFDYDELRMQTIGFSNKARLLVVAWYQINDNNIQIITAYKPSYNQIKDYQNA